MESKDELKEIDIKNCTCYYFEDKVNAIGMNFDNILLTKNYGKMFQFMTFHTKLQRVQKHCVLGSIK